MAGRTTTLATCSSSPLTLPKTSTNIYCDRLATAVHRPSSGLTWTEREVHMLRKSPAWIVTSALTLLSLHTAQTASAQYTISTLASSTGTTLITPHNGIAADSSGNVYAPASVPQVIVLKVNPSGSAAVVVGQTQPNAAFPGCGMVPLSIGMTDLGGTAIDTSGNLYIAQAGNGPVLRVSGGTVQCLDGGAYIGAVGIAADNAGDVWVSLGINGNVVYKISAGGAKLTVAGTGSPGCTGGAMRDPEGLAVDGAGNLYIADPGCNVVWKLPTGGGLTAFAGNGTPDFSGDGGAATSASLNEPESVAVDASGNIYIADQANNRIRKVTAGTITTIAGNGSLGYTGDGASALAATMSH